MKFKVEMTLDSRFLDLPETKEEAESVILSCLNQYLNISPSEHLRRMRSLSTDDQYIAWLEHRVQLGKAMLDSVNIEVEK